jgi:uncharacterized protein with von Willebrand factor type A (vWA) domain
MDKRESVLNTDRFDRRRFGQILEMSERLQEVEQKGQKVLPTFRPFMADMWASLYKMKPELLEEGQYDQHYQTNHNLLSKVMNDEGYIAARDATRLDDLSSALGTVRFSEKVYEWADEQRKENEELQQAINDALKAQQSLANALKKQQEAQEEMQDAEKNKDSQGKTNAKRKQTRAQKEQQKAQENYDQAMQQMQSQLSEALSQHGSKLGKALKEAKDQTEQAKEELVNLLAGGGSGAGDGEGELQKLPLRDQIKLAEMLSKNQKMKDIAEWAGRFKAIARKKQKSKHVETIDRSGVTLGTDVERLLPSELAAYKNPVTKSDFLRRYAEHQTMMYAPEGKETLGKGPMILCLDQSGSMHNLDEQSKGFALALMMIAKKQRRDFAIIPFSSSTKQQLLYYEKGKIKPSDLVKLVETFLGGGTNFLPPLNIALTTIEKHKRYSKADIVFVTDGDPSDAAGIQKYCGVDGEFTKKKKEKGFNVVSVLIGQGVSERHVKWFSDKIVRASDFNNDDVADTVFTI